MAIDINIPSQVKNYANLAGFPATGSLKTIFIAEDTNKTYRWTGSAYVEISASQATAWGAITGTLSNQTDLQNALNAKQPTLVSGTSIKTINSTSLLGSGDVAVQPTLVSATNIKTINGTTLLGSGDLVVGGGVTIGTTAITSGTVGRVLFEGTGNVVSESANLFFDNTNARLGVGTSSPSAIIHSVGSVTASGATARGNYFNNTLVASANGDILSGLDINPTFTNGAFTGVTNYALRLSTGGFLVGADFTQSSSAFKISGTDATLAIRSTSSSGFCGMNMYDNANNNIGSFQIGGTATGSPFAGNMFIGARQATGKLLFVRGVSATQSMTLFSTGNLLIQDGGTHTDAGYKLDVNGTARVTQMTFPATLDKKIFLYEGITDYAIGLAAGAIRLGTPSGNRVAMGNYTGATFTEICNVSPTGLNLLSGRVDLGADTSNVKLAIYTNTGVSMGLGVSAATFRFSAGGTSNNFVFFDDAAGNKLYSLISLTGAGYYGSGTINASSQLQVDSTTRGFLPPRMTTTQKNAIASPATGLMVYDTTLNLMALYNGTIWTTL